MTFHPLFDANWQATLAASVQRESYSFQPDMAELNFRKAAVLILFWNENGQPKTLVTVRASTMPTHAGEVSFPGGGLHEGESFQQAALREAQEEVGLDPTTVRVLGSLDDAWSGAGFALMPIVALSSTEPKLHSNAEVERVVTMNLSTDVEYMERTVKKFGAEFSEPFFRVKGVCNSPEDNVDVVGLTADMLGEAVEALRGEYTERGKRRHKYFKQYATAKTAK